MRTRRWFVFIGVFLAVSSISRLSAADNVCNETVPANRFIDGFPAYSQCTASTNSAIWSDNGINTSTSSTGAGWVRTQWSGGYQCTEYAGRYLYFKWNIQYQGGSAKDWCDGALPSTLTKTMTPSHGDVIVFAPGSCGADLTYGHVAVVDTVDTARSTVTFVEQNGASRRSCATSTASCFLHAVANTGTVASGGAGGSTGAAGAGGRAGSAAGTGGFANTGASAGKGGSTQPRATSGGMGGYVGVGGSSVGGGFGGSAGGATLGAGGFVSLSGTRGQAGYVPIESSDTSGADCACDLARPTGYRGDAVFLFFTALLLATGKRWRSRVGGRNRP
jgi:surface antigen